MGEPTRKTDDDEEREDLVAFLDGELTEEEAHKVEAELNRDPVTRARADALRKTWDLLDYLPQPEPSPNFTNRTMERLGPARKTLTLPRRRLRAVLVGLIWAAAILVAVAGGYGGMSRFLKSNGPTDLELARDLSVIENKHLYEVGEDMDFLRELDRPDQFGEETLGS